MNGIDGFFFLCLLLVESSGFVKLSALLSVQKENIKEISAPLGCREEFVTSNTAMAEKLGDKPKI